MRAQLLSAIGFGDEASVKLRWEGSNCGALSFVGKAESAVEATSRPSRPRDSGNEMAADQFI